MIARENAHGTLVATTHTSSGVEANHPKETNNVVKSRSRANHPAPSLGIPRKERMGGQHLSLPRRWQGCSARSANEFPKMLHGLACDDRCKVLSSHLLQLFNTILELATTIIHSTVCCQRHNEPNSLMDTRRDISATQKSKKIAARSVGKALYNTFEDPHSHRTVPKMMRATWTRVCCTTPTTLGLVEAGCSGKAIQETAPKDLFVRV